MKATTGNAAILVQAMNNLLKHWEQTQYHWKDQARESFEKDFLQELIHAVRTASSAAKESEELLRHIRRDCCE